MDSLCVQNGYGEQTECSIGSAKCSSRLCQLWLVPGQRQLRRGDSNQIRLCREEVGHQRPVRHCAKNMWVNHGNHQLND
jgi:hypothetical protein